MDIWSLFPFLPFILLISCKFLVLAKMITCTKFRHILGLFRLRWYLNVHDAETLNFLPLLAHLLAVIVGTAHIVEVSDSDCNLLVNTRELRTYYLAFVL